MPIQLDEEDGGRKTTIEPKASHTEMVKVSSTRIVS